MSQICLYPGTLANTSLMSSLPPLVSVGSVRAATRGGQWEVGCCYDDGHMIDGEEAPAIVGAYVDAAEARDRAAGEGEPIAFEIAERRWALTTLAYARFLEAAGSMAPIGLRAQAEAVLSRMPSRVSAFIEVLSTMEPRVPGSIVAWQSEIEDGETVLQLVWSLPVPESDTWDSRLTDRLLRLTAAAFADEDLSVYVKFVAVNEVDSLNLRAWSRAA